MAKLAAEMRQFRDVIFAYSLGNEIRPDLIRWYGMRRVSRFLAELYDIGKNLDPEGLFTYSNYPSAEYLDLSFLDLVCFNVYLHQEADFRRYMTHLLGLSGNRPLMLSETGMDTIREGEAHQAELLQWQARAAFEVGLSGFIIFAFTDEWHTGGSEITDWAFGLVTRERRPKQAFSAVAQVFAHPLPPALVDLPKVSVVVAAYNAEATLGACLDSLGRLNYPDYEIIVVDDGSADRTAEIARAAEVKVLACEHRGLAAARNAGIAAAHGEIVAFIDADAAADSDWLYHLVETMRRRERGRGRRSQFPARGAIPDHRRDRRGARASRAKCGSSDDSLAQMCGCNMAIGKAHLESLGGFDPVFTTAGDDVDISWRLLNAGAPGGIAYAPAAAVVHDRRGSVRAYLAQQRGYGQGEAMLARKYPERQDARIYGYSGWQVRWFGLPRIYRGAIGRGLFQTVYPAGVEQPLIDLPLSAWWIGLALLLILIGAADWPATCAWRGRPVFDGRERRLLRGPRAAGAPPRQLPHADRAGGAVVARTGGAQLCADARRRGARAFAQRDGRGRRALAQRQLDRDSHTPRRSGETRPRSRGAGAALRVVPARTDGGRQYRL